VTCNGGTIIVSVPDKRKYLPDMARPITSFEHFVRDFHEGGRISIGDHFRETGSIYRGLTGVELDAFVQQCFEEDANIHFHVWTPESFLRMLLDGRGVMGIDYEIVEFASYGNEALAVLKIRKGGVS